MDVDKSLDDAFDIEPENIDDEDIEIVDIEENNISILPDDTSGDKFEDYEIARKTLHTLISAGSESLEGILDVAQNSDSPRAYEVVATTFKNLAEATNQLLELQKKMKEINKADDDSPNRLSGGSTTNNVIFAGSTDQLQKFLNEKN